MVVKYKRIVLEPILPSSEILDRLETPFLGVEEGGYDRRESSFGEEDDDAIHFDDGSITFFGKEDSTDDER